MKHWYVEQTGIIDDNPLLVSSYENKLLNLIQIVFWGNFPHSLVPSKPGNPRPCDGPEPLVTDTVQGNFRFRRNSYLKSSVWIDVNRGQLTSWSTVTGDGFPTNQQERDSIWFKVRTFIYIYAYINNNKNVSMYVTNVNGERIICLTLHYFWWEEVSRHALLVTSICGRLGRAESDWSVFW